MTIGLRVGDAAILIPLSLYVVLYTARTCCPLPAVLTRALSKRVAVLAVVMTVPLSCCLDDRLFTMALATVVALVYGDYIIFSSNVSSA